jgi:hypothetical protein
MGLQAVPQVVRATNEFISWFFASDTVSLPLPNLRSAIKYFGFIT